MTTPDPTPEELREAAQRARESVDSWPAFLFDRAADELERLREQNESGWAEVKRLAGERDRLTVEASRLRAQVAPAPEWKGLTEQERAAFVDAVCDYGTAFVSPLFALAESLEDTLKARNAASPAAPAQQAEPQRYSPTGEGGMEVDSLGDWVRFNPAQQAESPCACWPSRMCSRAATCAADVKAQQEPSHD